MENCVIVTSRMYSGWEELKFEANMTVSDMVEELICSEDAENFEFLYDIENAIEDLVDTLTAQHDNIPMKALVQKCLKEQDAEIDPTSKNVAVSIEKRNKKAALDIIKLTENKWWAYNIVADLPNVNNDIEVHFYQE
jgi:phosphoribosylaminoimidazole carboxylase (NCAIR synthetase)